MRAVLYTFKDHNKINGTLFYCLEYFAMAKTQDKNVSFYIYNINKNDFHEIINVFKDKYNLDKEIYDSIYAINGLKELYSIKAKSYLILDVHSFSEIYFFLKAPIHCYSNEPHQMIRSTEKEITYYGHYSYQNFDVDVKLKLNFGIFKKINDKSDHAVFVSSIADDYKNVAYPEELKGIKLFTKKKNSHYPNLFELFDTLYYYHSARDTNNRLIPESFFYNKKIIVKYSNQPRDSIYYRYEDILKNGLVNYTLTKDDIMLTNFLRD